MARAKHASDHPSRRRLLHSALVGVVAGTVQQVGKSQTIPGGSMPRILVFDVNETLLDLKVLEPHFERIFGDRTMLHEWFNQVIQFAEALTLAGDYRNFGDVARAA